MVFWRGQVKILVDVVLRQIFSLFPVSYYLGFMFLRGYSFRPEHKIQVEFV